MKISLAEIDADLDKLGIKLVDKHLLVPGQDKLGSNRGLLIVLRRSLPRDDMGDGLYALYLFMLAHGRRPTSAMLLNDVIYRKKISGALNDPLVAAYTDKELAKILIGEKVGREHVIPTIKVLHDDMEIETYRFPDRCIIKPTHSSQRTVNKKTDDEVPLSKLKRWLMHNFYDVTREKHYRYLRPKIIVEPDLYDDPNMMEVGIFCIRGKAKIATAVSVTENEMTLRHYTAAWEDLGCSMGLPTTEYLTAKPRNLDAMINAAELLASDFGLIRVDMYTNQKRFFIGEMTQTHGSGTYGSYPPDAEERVSKVLFRIDESSKQRSSRVDETGMSENAY